MTHNTETARLREVLEKYADELCEGWCKENGGYFDDCSGCPARQALQSQPPEANAELVEALEDACGIALADFAVKIYFDTESGASKAHALLRKIWRVANRTGLHPSSDNQEKG